MFCFYSHDTPEGNSPMWNGVSTVAEIMLRTTIMYCVVLIGIRLSGKREVGQMTPFDLVLLLLIANAVQNAMTGPDTSVLGGVVAAVTLLVLNALVSRLVVRDTGFRKLVVGSPTLLVYNGEIFKEHLQKEQVTVDALMVALREHGVGDLRNVHQAVLETDGSISVLTNDEMPSVSRPYHHIRFQRK